MSRLLINPRLTDFHGIAVPQVDLDFAIPFFNEDVPLYVDPFLLWKSPSQLDQALHTSLINAFNHLGMLDGRGEREKAINILVRASECDEVGLGSSGKRKGKRISKNKAAEILDLFREIPNYQTKGFRHFEEIQFFIEGISKDRISDFTCNFIKSFLVDFTIDQCHSLRIPTGFTNIHIYNYQKNDFEFEKVELPINPQSGEPLILVPKRFLRFMPWISYDNYFEHHCPQDEIFHPG
ncbi:hypothetical protein [Methyloferula stellata]|uniref:hypothetical protein n=1 Tax=Methyloferula stellata TaxID=876270 RepID=UPI000367BBBE|nr:hypothetical protein [Methyloferula stellata]